MKCDYRKCKRVPLVRWTLGKCRFIYCEKHSQAIEKIIDRKDSWQKTKGRDKDGEKSQV